MLLESGPLKQPEFAGIGPKRIAGMGLPSTQTSRPSEVAYSAEAEAAEYQRQQKGSLVQRRLLECTRPHTCTTEPRLSTRIHSIWAGRNHVVHHVQPSGRDIVKVVPSHHVHPVPVRVAMALSHTPDIITELVRDVRNLL